MEPKLEPILWAMAVDIRRYNPSTLVWRKGKWYVQVTKPVELQYGSDKQSRRSTGTSDKHEARFLQHQLTQRIYEGFDKALERTDPVFEALRPILESEGVNPKQWYREGLVELTVRGDKTLAHKVTGKPKITADGTPVRFIEKWSASNHVELLGVVSGLGYTVPATVIEYLSQEDRSKVLQVAADGMSQPSTDTTIKMVKALPERMAHEMLEFFKGGEPVIRLAENAQTPQGATLGDVVERYLTWRPEKSRHGDKQQLKKWLEHPRYSRLPLTDADHYDAYDFLYGFDEDLTQSSIRVLRAAMSNVFRWAKTKRELAVAVNPFVDLDLTGIGKDGTEKRPFTPAELDKLFAQKMSEVDKSAFKILLATGMRGGELMQVTSLSEEDGIKFLDLRNLRTKTKGSRRMVPLHDRLTNTGFPLKTNQGRLNRIIREHFDDKTVSLHSLRHTWKDLARDAGIPEEMHKFISGHSAGDESSKYGVGPSLPARHKAIMAMSFPWLEL